MLTLSLRASPDPGKVALGIVQWAHLIGDFRPAFADIRHIFDRHQKEHWSSEGASTGRKWPDNWEPEVPHLPPQFRPRSYPAWKRALLGHTDTLQFTGRLKAAATGGPGSLTNTAPTYMEMGVNSSVVPYAEDHHLGRKVMSSLFGREVQLKRREIIRFNGSPLGTKSAFSRKDNRTSFGYAVRQTIQAHIVRARRQSLGFDTTAADATIATLRNASTT